MDREMVNYDDENRREAFEERAAILEFDAGLSRAEAEREAAKMVEARFPLPKKATA